MAEELKNNKVPYPVFTGVIGVIIIALGWFFVSLAQTNEQGKDTQDEIYEVRIKQAAMQASYEQYVKSIDTSLAEIRLKLFGNTEVKK